MAVVSNTIPPPLQAEVDAALAWFNAGHGDQFEVTGIIDAEQSLQSGYPRELRLVLCGGDSCQRRNFSVTNTDAGLDVEFVREATDPATDAASPQSELDPPPGARRNWLDSVLQRHSFTLLLFYRGFW